MHYNIVSICEWSFHVDPQHAFLKHDVIVWVGLHRSNISKMASIGQVDEQEAEGSGGSKPSPVKLSHFNFGHGSRSSFDRWVRGIEFVYSRTSGPQDNHFAVDLA